MGKQRIPMQRKLAKASQSAALKAGRPGNRRRPAEVVETGQEQAFYLAWMRTGSLATITLTDNTEIRCRIEWYDRSVVCVRREDGVQVLLYKHAVRQVKGDCQ
jgi:sRNA-binding regulator protein Hfq